MTPTNHPMPNQDHLHGRGDLNLAAAAIRSIEWQGDGLLVRAVLQLDDLKSVVQRALRGEIPTIALHAWAEAIEGRTDLLDYESQAVPDALFEIANPEINGKLTTARLEEILAGLK